MMTNFPARFAPHPCEMPLLQALQLFWRALGMMTWSPRRWALHHDSAFDLPSAWLAACYSWDYAEDNAEQVEIENSTTLTSN